MKVRGFLKRQWRDWRATILFFVFVVVPVKSVLADMNWVPSGSMNPTIVEGDLIYVDKLAYDLRFPLTLQSLQHRADPGRGDISVLFSPQDGTRLVKRVIGLPGDELKLMNNILSINGEQAAYSELPANASRDLEEALERISVFAEEDLGGRPHAVMSIPAIRTKHRSFDPITIPPDCYFVMGDNRDNSLDSRMYGVVHRKQFVGKASHVIASFNILNKYQPRIRRFWQELQ